MSYYAPSKRNAAYQTSATLTASQSQLLVMLYDGAHRFLVQAASSMREDHFEDAHNKLRRAEMIISHLHASLVFDKGGADLANHLASLFTFCLRHLNSARVNRDPKRIEEVDGLLMPLRNAWATID